MYHIVCIQYNELSFNFFPLFFVKYFWKVKISFVKFYKNHRENLFWFIFLFILLLLSTIVISNIGNIENNKERYLDIEHFRRIYFVYFLFNYCWITDADAVIRPNMHFNPIQVFRNINIHTWTIWATTQLSIWYNSNNMMNAREFLISLRQWTAT